MKIKTAILIAFAVGAPFWAHAQTVTVEIDVPPPSVGIPGVAPKLYSAKQGAFNALEIDVPPPSVDFPGVAPKLYPAEQGAFKALEVATLMVESKIEQKGCQAAVYPFEVHTIYDGSGTAVLGQFPNSIMLNVALGGESTNNGRWYTVSGSGALGGMQMTILKSQGSFNIGSSIQEFSMSWEALSYVTRQPENFNATIIKDNLRLSDLQPVPAGFDDTDIPVSTVISYGYVQIIKDNYDRAQYWQQSRTWRDDGINAGTYWLHTRVAPTGLTCIIEVKLQGYGESPADNIEGFNERGSLEVKNVAVGPFVSN